MTTKPELPLGWIYPDEDEARSLYIELQKELPPGHLLYQVPVETYAMRDGNDDTLFRHLNDPERFTIIHLSWLGRTEINAQHPTVEFDGTFAEFLAQQERILNQLRGGKA
jgi:hypothetical protein